MRLLNGHHARREARSLANGAVMDGHAAGLPRLDRKLNMLNYQMMRLHGNCGRRRHKNDNGTTARGANGHRAQSRRFTGKAPPWGAARLVAPLRHDGRRVIVTDAGC
jgi:hypothetical protein